MLEYLDTHPELWGYVIIPLLGYALNELAARVAARHPAALPVVEWMIAHLPALRGALDRARGKGPKP